ncbi:uncharacterized protein Pyn_28864 [Prunus yedoensis var. nudiflora]|uniref:Uncharacterized protein n=1 Tax=Prunus yedoensis var. nudiflora TaxID=2094558 RepID=A0A314ZF31_PRUYE|nr:uncharacterized protein Pyn_28864 [Prunus yedoensis var. nudiflora]
MSNHSFGGVLDSFLCSFIGHLKQWSCKGYVFGWKIGSVHKGSESSRADVRESGQFVCESSSLKVGNRVHGLTADEELERRQFYFLLPMDLLYSVLTHEELSSLTYKASKALKHRSFNSFSKIFPVLGEFCMFPSEAKRLDKNIGDDISPSSHSEPMLVLVERYSKQRSWKPALETIIETPSTH